MRWYPGSCTVAFVRAISPLLCRLCEGLHVFSGCASAAYEDIDQARSGFWAAHKWKQAINWSKKYLLKSWSRQKNVSYLEYAKQTCSCANISGAIQTLLWKCIQESGTIWKVQAHISFATVWKAARGFLPNGSGSMPYCWPIILTRPDRKIQKSFSWLLAGTICCWED